MAMEVISTPEEQAQIVIEATRRAMAMGLSPDQFALIFGSLSDHEAAALAYSCCGVGNGETLRQIALASKSWSQQ